MRLRTKLLFVFLGSGLFLLAQGLAAAYALRVVGRDVDRLQRYTQTDDLFAQLKTELARLPEADSLERSGGERRALTDQADRTLILCRSLERLTSTESSRQAIAQVVEVVTDYRRAGRAYALAIEAEQGGFEQRDAAQRAHQRLLEVQGSGAIEPIGQEARLAIKAVVRRAEVLNRWVTLGGLSLALLLTLASALVLARVTAQPVVRLLRAAREIGRGNLETTIEVRGNDEFAELSRAFNDMTLRLRKVYDGLEAEVRKRTEELQKREKDLERERRLAAIGRLAAGVAHEVNNPLTVIAGAAEGLRDRANDEALQQVEAFEDFPDYLETIESEAYRLKRLVRRLLDFARVRAGGGEMYTMDLADVLHDAVSLARLDPLAKEHPVHAAIEGPLPVEGDADSLKQAALNLLFNGLRAVKDTGGGEVTLEAKRVDEQVVIEVRDNGVGVDAADLDRLFEPFFTTAKEGEGTGLGLSLVYGIVDRHRGAIAVSSEGVGQGATFRMALPVSAEDPED